MGPEPARIQALLISRRKAESGKFRIGRDVSSRVNVFPDQSCNVGVAADKMMSKERMRRSAFIGDAVHRRGQRLSILIEGLCGPWLPIVLLHMAALAVALEARIKIGVAGTVSIRAVRPLRVGALNGKTAHPFADGIFD